MRKSVLVMAMLAAAAVSGCIVHDGVKNPSLTELAVRPGDFVGRSVVVNASPVKYTASGSFTHYIDVSLDDGSTGRLDIKYDDGIDWEHCTIRGVMVNSTLCDCESAKCNGRDCTVADESAWEYIDTRLVSECHGVSKYFVLGNIWQRSLFRCVPGTEQGKYYMNVTNVTEAVPAG